MRWWLLAAGAALFAAVGLASCSGPDKRDELESYLTQANAVLEDSASEFDSAERAYKRFSAGNLGAHKAPHELKQASDAILAARRRLEDLEPPPVAERLDRRVLRLFSLYAEFSRETAKLAVYLPAAADLTKKLVDANERLDDELRAGVAHKQVEALGSYVEELDKLAKTLTDLKPPMILVKSNQARAEQLETVSALGLKLQHALKREDAAAVAHLLIKFRTAAAKDGGSDIDKASLHEYNRHYRQLGQADAAVREEQGRLSAKLTAPPQA